MCVSECVYSACVATYVCVCLYIHMCVATCISQHILLSSTLISLYGNNTGVQITASTLVTKPRVKYIEEGGSGTVAACLQYTSVGNTNSLTPVFRNDIKWLWMNATSTVQLPNSNINSNVWSNGYILRAANVNPRNSGNYCCVIGEIKICTENAITQLIVSGYWII